MTQIFRTVAAQNSSYNTNLKTDGNKIILPWRKTEKSCSKNLLPMMQIEWPVVAEFSFIWCKSKKETSQNHPSNDAKRKTGRSKATSYDANRKTGPSKKSPLYDANLKNNRSWNFCLKMQIKITVAAKKKKTVVAKIAFSYDANLKNNRSSFFF